MIILGINAYHGDSSACILRDGILIAAAEEERFRRIKHWAGFPSEAIKYCLGAAKVYPKDINHVSINQDSKANLMEKISYTLLKRPDLKMVLDRFKKKKERNNIIGELKKIFPNDELNCELHEIEHHLSHLGSAFFVSPFEKAVTVSIDGFGDFASAAWGVGERNKITIDNKIYFPHSLGIFYQALTQFLGFTNYGDEYKVMGLAPYGQPNFINEMRKIVELKKDGSFQLNLNYFRHHKEKVEMEWENGEPIIGKLYSDNLHNLLGESREKNQELTQRHKDIARSIQLMYEEAFIHLLNSLYVRYGIDKLTLAGGCAMNSVANGKIYQNTPFKSIYIQSAAGDAGGAIGAAFVTWHKLNNGIIPEFESKINNKMPLGRPKSRKFVMDHAYWGQEFSIEQIKLVLEKNKTEINSQNCSINEYFDEQELCNYVANEISKGLVIGWFQGRMEWGPRALGNRSILGDPRRANMKDILNMKIKRRESFRPFAPSILKNEVHNWFEIDDDVPFMMQVYQVKEAMREKIPAVTHVDGSGRLQTVYKETNPKYYQLIEAFYKITNIPLILNTSFNENEPVVCKPEEALACFLRTKMDILVVGNLVVSRNLMQ